MTTQHQGKSLLTLSLIVICLFSIVLSFSLAGDIRKREARFKKEKATLVREKMEIRDELDSLKNILKTKSAAIESLEAEKKAMSEQLSRLEQMAEGLKNANNEEVDQLRKDVAELQKEVDGFRNATPVQLIEDVMSREIDDNVRRILSDAIAKVEAVREGRAVQLEPIVVTGNGAGESAAFGTREGRIVSLDRKNNLIVIDLGRSNGVRDGQRFTIFDRDTEIARATVIRLRYKLCAAFVDRFIGRNTIQDVREDAKVAVAED